jgi:hypothetical protein
VCPDAAATIASLFVKEHTDANQEEPGSRLCEFVPLADGGFMIWEQNPCI